MNPKEKAKDLINTFSAIQLFAMNPGQREYAQTLRGPEALAKFISDQALHVHDQAKKYSLAAVDEIMKSNPINPRSGGFFETTSDMVEGAEAYWNQVKEEIQKS